METKIIELLSDIINPASGKTLQAEEKIKDINIENEQNKITLLYNRDGISAIQKKTIEKEIIEKLSSLFNPDKISIKTVSTEDTNFTQTKKETDVKKEKKRASPVNNRREIKNVKNIIAISSGKGGVGKSTIAVNLAITLKNMGLKVGLIDTDIYGPSMPILLGKRDATPTADENKKIIPIENYGLKFISFGLFTKEDDAVIWRGPMLGGVLNQFFFDVNWGELDYLILDLPPGTGDVPLSIMQNLVVDGAIIVSTPQDVALLDSKKGLQMFNKLELPIIGLVENMSSFICHNCNQEHHIFGKDGVKKAAKKLNVPFITEIPLDTNIMEASDNGIPYMESDKNEGTTIWNSYKELANKLTKFF